MDARATNWRTSKLLVFDTETTGLDPLEDRVIQFAAAVYDPAVKRYTHEFVTYCSPGDVPISAGAAAVNGITAGMLQGLPTLDDLLPSWLWMLYGLGPFIPVAYNAPFDLAFVAAACRRLNLPMPVNPLQVLDPCAWARRFWRQNKLGQLAQRLELPPERAHDALGDVRTTGRALVKMLDGIKPPLPDDLEDVLARQEECIQIWQEATRHRYRDLLERVR
jgi:DNA polymerase III epsilon subunit-like protein